MSQPTVITLDDNSENRHPAFENKQKYTTDHNESFTDHLGMTEIRPDIQPPDDRSNHLTAEQTEEEFLAQFDLNHLHPDTQEKFKQIFIKLRQAFAVNPTDIGHTNLVQ